MDSPIRPENKVAVTRKSTSRVLVHSTLAVGVTLIALALGQGAGTGRDSAISRADHKKDSESGGLHSGVILFNKQKTVALDINLHPPSHDEAVRTLRQSMSIPFSGEYWFFRFPYRRPPPTALRSEGDPTDTSVFMRSVHPLQMHAWQELRSPISVTSCRWIDLILHNADTQPEAVQIELAIVDSLRGRRVSQMLGQQGLATPYRSVPDREFGSPTETFRFAMPQHPQLRSFNSLDVWFHLKPPRMNQGATVSIQRFDLEP